MKKYLRIVSVFLFSSLLFLIFLAGSGLVQARGADIAPRLGKIDLWEPVSAAVDNQLSIMPAAPDADVDLEIFVVDVTDPVTAGTSILYTVVITNHGPSPATNVVVTNDFPPSQLSFISSTPDVCDGQGNIVTCTLGNLEVDPDPGSRTQFDLLMFVKSGATDPLLNPITVSSSDTDLNPNNNSETVNTTIEYEYDLVVTKVDNIDLVTPGGTLIYTVTVDNTNGPSDAYNVILADTLPGELNLVSITPSQGTCNESTMVCELGTIGANLTADVTLVTTVTQSTPVGTISNTAEVSSPDDSLLTNNTTTETTSIVAPNQADLSITKSDFPDPVAPGGTLTYTISITNNGQDDATNVILTDTLPLEVNLLSITPSQGTCIGTVCELGTITASLSANVTLVTTVTQSTPLGTIITNMAEVSSPEDPTLGFVEEPTTVNADVDLFVSKSAPTTVIAGESLVYTVTVSNSSLTYDAPNVLLIDTLPAGVTFDSSDPGSPDCTQAAGIVTCNLDTLAADSSTDVTINVTVDPDASGTLTNTVVVSSDANDPDETYNQDSTQTTVTYSSDLSVTKIDEPDPVFPGGILTYTLTITNDGPSDTSGVQVIDTLPAEVSLQSITPSQGICEGSDCTIGPMAAGSTETITIVTTVDIEASLGIITNHVQVSGYDTDPLPGNNSYDETTTIDEPEADLSITKSGFPDLVAPYDMLTYTLIVDNNGPDDASNVVIVDTLPVEVNYVSSQPDQMCSEIDGVVTCYIDTLPASGEVDVNILVEVDSMAVGPLVNEVTVSSDTSDPNTDYNDDTLSTTVEESADLVVHTTHTPEPANPGEILTYTLTITNNGPLDAPNVVLTDTLPEEVSFISSIPGPPDCEHTMGVVVCDLGTINQGDSTQIVLFTQIANDAWGTITNTAMVSSDLNDPDELNNLDLGYTTVGPGANLSLSKTGSPDPVVTGGILTYTLTISNGGPLTATNVHLRDVLPGNVSFLSSSPASPTCTESDGVVNCTLGNLYSEETNDVSIIVQVSSSSIESLVNQATVSSVTYDQDDVNNTASDTTTVIDVEAPTVEWISPVEDDQRYDVGGEVILLEVEAIDNVAIERVDFLWWDHEYNNYEGRWVDIGSVFVTPYSIEFDTNILYDGYNQVYAKAYDTSGNVSNRPRILLFRVEYGYRQYLPVISR